MKYAIKYKRLEAYKGTILSGFFDTPEKAWEWAQQRVESNNQPLNRYSVVGIIEMEPEEVVTTVWKEKK